MENFVFSKRSKTNLVGVHPDLIWICARGLILSDLDFVVTEGVRSYERQVRLKREGKSKTLNSKHLQQRDGFGHAFDIAALVKNKVTWDDKYYKIIAEAMYEAAKEINAKITWGGEWGWDCPHFQYDDYPTPFKTATDIIAGLKIASTTL